MRENLMILFQAPPITVDLIVNGILIGSIFALAAYGMALVWGVLRIINIAQGEFVILGSYITIALYHAGIHPLYGVPTAAVVLFVVGWLLYRLIIFRLVDRDLFTSVLATYGIAILLQQLMNTIFGGGVQIADAKLGTIMLMGGLVAIANVKIVGFVLGGALALILVTFLKRSRMGQAIRATAQNTRAARVLGIDTDRVYATTYALNASLCGAAGALVAMAYTVHPYIGLVYTIRSFLIVVVAGLGNLVGVIAAGLGLGAAENLAGFVLGAQYQLAFTFLLLVVILVWRSWWLARKRESLQ